MTPEIERLAIQYATALVEYYEADRSLTDLRNPQYKQIFYTDRLAAKDRRDAAETALDIACQDQAKKLATSS
jgi:hypothetical protein